MIRYGMKYMILATEINYYFCITLPDGIIRGMSLKQPPCIICSNFENSLAGKHAGGKESQNR